MFTNVNKKLQMCVKIYREKFCLKLKNPYRVYIMIDIGEF